MVRVVAYASEYVGSDIQHDLADIRASSLVNNRRDQVTGTLLFDRGYFVQVLEGLDEPVSDVLRRIEADKRSGPCSILFDIPLPERSFEDWDMWVGKVNPERIARMEVELLRDAYTKSFRFSPEEFMRILRQMIWDRTALLVRCD